jgi:hypothetical protein
MNKTFGSRGPQNELTYLRAENLALRNEVRFLRTHPKIARGMQGEELIVSLVDGLRLLRNGPFDVLTKRTGVRLEIKSSSLLVIQGKETRRWVWTKIHGERGLKRFDHLILVGDVDPRFAHLYRGGASPYVFFDVPFKDVVKLTLGVRVGRASIIHLTTNPRTVRSQVGIRLFRDYQITVSELQRRYALRSSRRSNDSLRRITRKQPGEGLTS